MKRLLIFLIFVFPFLLFAQPKNSSRTVGLLLNKQGTENGYILFAPLFSKTTFLISRCGRLVHSWKSKYNPGQSVYLLNDGRLLRTGNDSSKYFFGGGGVVQLLDWDSKVLWQYKISDSLQRQHHDIYPMPNGNILLIVWEKISRTEALLAGRDSSLLASCIWSEKIMEIRPKGSDQAEIVWQWRIWDHLIQNKDPALKNFADPAKEAGRLNINYGALKSEDWLHFNSVAYNAERDEILISNRNLNEIYIIDHSTTSTEASGRQGGKKGRGGDLLYRWGNPEAYGRDAKEVRQLYRQHSANWIPRGLKDEDRIILFNNGTERGEEEFSTVMILEPPLNSDGNYLLPDYAAYGPGLASWKYQATNPPDFYSRNVSSAQRLSNGNTLICEGAQGKFFEIDSKGNIIWTYVNPVDDKGAMLQGASSEKNQVFRCIYYEKIYPAFKGKKLKEGLTIEKDKAPLPCK